MMCTTKICLNSVPGGFIKFILGASHEDDPACKISGAYVDVGGLGK